MNYLTHQLLNPQEINLLKKNLTLQDISWEDGKKTAGNHAAKIKEIPAASISLTLIPVSSANFLKTLLSVL